MKEKAIVAGLFVLPFGSVLAIAYLGYQYFNKRNKISDED